MESIRAEAVVKLFGSTVALNGIDLEIAGGELFFLLGASGCGRAVLMDMGALLPWLCPRLGSEAEALW